MIWRGGHHAYSVCFDTPTKGAKSPAGRPLFIHVSNTSKRCWGDN
jgi:hypothetical protein